MERGARVCVLVRLLGLSSAPLGDEVVCRMHESGRVGVPYVRAKGGRLVRGVAIVAHARRPSRREQNRDLVVVAVFEVRARLAPHEGGQLRRALGWDDGLVGGEEAVPKVLEQLVRGIQRAAVGATTHDRAAARGEQRRVKQRRLARLLQRICWRAERERRAAPDGQLLRTARLRRADVERAERAKLREEALQLFGCQLLRGCGIGSEGNTHREVGRDAFDRWLQ